MNPDHATDRPLVTVITATYNLVTSGRVEAFRQCLESVRAQTYEPLEHLIIDGASTDGTLELLREYEARGWVKVHSEPDKGIYDAFNKGIRLASGKYCAFLNSDDWWHGPRGVELSVHLLEKARGDFSYAPATYAREDGSFIRASEPDMAAFFCFVPCNHQTMFYRTDVLREYLYDSASYRLAADYDLTTRLLLSGRRAVYVPLNFSTFRMGGISGNAQLHDEECLRVLHRYYAPIIGEKAAERLYKWIAPASLLRTLASLVQTGIMLQVERSFVPIPCEESGSESLLLRYRPKVAYTRQIWKGVLGLPLLKAVTSGCRTTYSLLGVLPVWVNQYSTRRGQSVCHSWLFGVVPLWRRSELEGVTVKHRLFFVIPVWSRMKRS